jgi:hypothetical protein
MLQKYIEMLHMLQWLYTYVASFCSQCFICVFRNICCNCVYLDVCICSTLHVFYSGVVYGCNGFQVCFRCVFQVFHKHVLSISTVFRRMLQPLYFDVSKIDQMLHLSSSYLLLHRLYRSRQGIHMNDGWARDEGATCVGRK